MTNPGDSYINEFGFFFFFKMAVAVSSAWVDVSSEASNSETVASCQLTALCSEPEASLQKRVSIHPQRWLIETWMNSLEVDLPLVLDMIRFCRHVGRLLLIGGKWKRSN
jgi:hypothetical protein